MAFASKITGNRFFPIKIFSVVEDAETDTLIMLVGSKETLSLNKAIYFYEIVQLTLFMLSYQFIKYTCAW